MNFSDLTVFSLQPKHLKPATMIVPTEKQPMTALQAITIVARKELTSLKMNTLTVVTLCVLTLVWTFIPIASMLAGSPFTPASRGPITFIPLTVGLFVAFVVSSKTFISEKTEGNIETLLCGPFSVRTILIGKVAGVAIVACSSVVVSGVILVVANFLFLSEMVVTVPVIIFFIGIAPLILSGMIAFLGTLQWMLGMRESRIMNFVTTLFLAGLLSAGNYFSITFKGLSWVSLGIWFAVACVGIGCAGIMMKRINVERIVTSCD